MERLKWLGLVQRGTYFSRAMKLLIMIKPMLQQENGDEGHWGASGTRQPEVFGRGGSQALGQRWHIQPNPSWLMSLLEPAEKGSQVPSFLIIRVTIKPLGISSFSRQSACSAASGQARTGSWVRPILKGKNNRLWHESGP